MVGNYKMIWSSVPGELNTSIKWNISFSAWYIDYSTNDTINAHTWLRVIDSNDVHPGNTKISSNITFHDINVSDPKINVWTKKVTGGFNGDMNVVIYSGGKFDGDTLIMNYMINTPPQHNMVCKYLKY